MSTSEDKQLFLRFHGRIIDSLGIQMYQSPVAALAELVANAWDADAKKVEISLPDSLDADAEIIVSDDGHGMSFEECQKYYLQVGRNRRFDLKKDKTKDGRPVLGRKGIGKLAGFGIAEIVEVETISEETGERTKFTLNINDLRGSEYVSTESVPVKVEFAEDADEQKKKSHSTTITLKNLKFSRRQNEESFARSMANRFLVNQAADNFEIIVNDKPLPTDDGIRGVEFDFPNDYRDDEKIDGLRIVDGWGHETVDGEQIQWRIRFTKTPIGTDEFRGVSVYCGVKVAQSPFFFNLSGGLDGQHGQQYMSGVIKADYLDKFESDIITTERQRINWEIDVAQGLLTWGQNKTKELLKIWKARRGEENLQLLEDKLAGFGSRLARLQANDRKTVTSAIRKIAAIDALEEAQFRSLANAMLTAWEGGRLKDLIEDLSRLETMDEGVLVTLLAEAEVVTALHMAEAVRAKLEIIQGLRQRIESHDLENAVRDYIAENPWLLSPEWETFKKETSITNLVRAAAKDSGIDSDPAWAKRIDLVLSSGKQLLIVEFMRPGLTVDRDHLNRFQQYVDILREKIRSNTDLIFRPEHVSGLLVAENLARPSGMSALIQRLANDEMKCLEWRGLLERAEDQWREFLVVLGTRSPDDERLADLSEHKIKFTPTPHPS